jgi:hypothetical protein
MESLKWKYYQYRKTQDYPVYLRVVPDEGHTKLEHLFNELGFSEVPEKDSKKISLQRSLTRILTIQGAGARLQQQINGSSILDKFGHESLSLQGTTPVYTYRRVGVMGLPLQRTLWDLAINNDNLQTDQMVGLRVMLTRYLAFALSEQGLISYWGTVKDETIIVMKQGDSFGEAVFVDEARGMVFWNGGEMRLPTHLKFLRKDKDHRAAGKMSREELISFLSVSTCLLSFTGISTTMKRAIYALSSRSTGSYATPEAPATL